MTDYLRLYEGFVPLREDAEEVERLHRVVVWLRGGGGSTTDLGRWYAARFADAIERGEHLEANDDR